MVAIVGIFFFKLPFPVIVLGAGLIGLVGSTVYPRFFLVIKEKEMGEFEKGYVRICENEDYCHIDPSKQRNVYLLMSFLGLWLLPMLMLYAWVPEPVFYKEGLFFTKAAFLTFGGAYAVLAYIAQAG